MNKLTGRETYPYIADEIEKRINSGQYVDYLPRYRELVVEFECSSRTIDKALDQLKGRGIIYTIPGRGIYVKKDGS